MKKVGSLLIALMMLLNVSFGYTLTVTYNGNQMVREVEGGQSVIVGLSSRDDANYVVDSGNAVLKVYGNRRQFVMPEANVDISVALKEENGSGEEDSSEIVVTYDANGGSFASGTSNVLRYTPPVTTEVYTSKTSNVSEDGTTADTTTGYGNSQSITDTVTIEGASALEVTITYQTETTSCDWVCVYDNTVTPDSSNYAESVSGKLGGTTKNTQTFTVTGDTAQFYFKSDSSTCNYYGYYAEVREATGLASGTYEVPERAGYMLGGWSTSNSATEAEYRGAITPTENITLYAVWGDSLEDVAQAGDYVTYTPSATTVDLTTITGVTQNALNPSTTQWRVLSNDGTTVELVSAESVGNLKLGVSSTRATDGTYSAGSAAEEELSKSNYVEIGRILREISEAYIDEEVATGGRGLGYKEGSSVEEFDTTDYPITWENTYTNGNNGFPYRDDYYIDDVNALVNNNMLHSSGQVWLASRDLRARSDHSGFYVRSVYSYGSLNINCLFFENSDGSAFSYTYTRGVRPVVSLASGLKISGEGTEGNPWKIN